MEPGTENLLQFVLIVGTKRVTLPFVINFHTNIQYVRIQNAQRRSKK
jgi:hypothetical protein